MNLQDIQLTEQDFNMLIDSLDQLPNKHKMSSFTADILGTMMFKPGSHEEQQFKKERERIDRQHKKEIDDMKEEIAILKSKMIMLKRYLITNGALKTTNKILGNE